MVVYTYAARPHQTDTCIALYAHALPPPVYRQTFGFSSCPGDDGRAYTDRWEGNSGGGVRVFGAGKYAHGPGKPEKSCENL